MNHDYLTDPARRAVESLLNSVNEMEALLDKITEQFTEVANCAYEDGVEQGQASSHCATGQDHRDLAHDEYGATPDEWADDHEDHQALGQLLADLSAGVPATEAMRRLPVATVWRWT